HSEQPGGIIIGPGASFPMLKSFLVIDISNPAAARVVGSNGWLNAEITGFGISGNHALASSTQLSGLGGYSNFGGIDVLDISDPTNPRFVGRYTSSSRVGNLAVSRNRAYLSVSSVQSVFGVQVSAGLEMVDLSDPANPQRLIGYQYSNAGG